jgi:hypothetical protein
VSAISVLPGTLMAGEQTAGKRVVIFGLRAH